MLPTPLLRLSVTTTALVALVATTSAAAPAQPAADTRSDVRIDLGDVAVRDTLPPTSVTTYVWRPGDPAGTGVTSWRTTATAGGLTERVAARAPLATRPVVGGEELVVGDPVPGASPVVGFGGALTDSAAYVIDTSPQRDAILVDLFGADGASLDVVRLAMGASDFVATAGHASYADAPDPTLAAFSIERDRAHVLPVLRDALAINPDLVVVAAPWSAPGWMKRSGKYVGDCWQQQNQLRDDMVEVYARYYVRYLQAYAAEGVDVAQVSLGNEPQHCNSTYPTMTMPVATQARLATVLRPALDAAGFADVAILGWDHNYVDEGTDRPTGYPAALLAAAGEQVDAIGYHCYEPNRRREPAAQQTTARPAWMTECTGTTHWRDTRQNLVNETHLALLNPLRYGAVASLYWNLALDTAGGPHLGGCATCRGMVEVGDEGYAVGHSAAYWSQLSRFVQPGAVLLASTQRSPVETVAYANPDGSRVLVVLNASWSTLDWGTPADGSGTPEEQDADPVGSLLGTVRGLVRGLLGR